MLCANRYRAALVEACVELDEDAMEKFFEGEEPSDEDMKKLIRKGTIGGAFVPVLCGTAFKNKGVQVRAHTFVHSLTHSLTPLLGTRSLKRPGTCDKKRPNHGKRKNKLRLGRDTDDFFSFFSFLIAAFVGCCDFVLAGSNRPSRHEGHCGERRHGGDDAQA